MNRPVEVYSDSYEDPDCLSAYNKSKSVHVVNSEFLFETSGNQPSLVACCSTVDAWLDLVDPSGGDSPFVDRQWYQGPSPIAVNGVNLGLHGVLPMWVDVGFLECDMVGLIFRGGVRLRKLNVTCKILEVSGKAPYPFRSSKMVRGRNWWRLW